MGKRGYRIIVLGIFCLFPRLCPAPPNPAGDVAQAQYNAALYNLWAADHVKGSDSKTMKMMMMMQMMQANANVQAAQQNQKNSDKQDKKDKQETKKSDEIAKLEIPDFKTPQASPDEKVDLGDLTYKPSKEPLPKPPIPLISIDSAQQIVSQFQPIKPAAKESPVPSPSAKPIVDPGPSTIAKTIELPPKPEPGEISNKIGYDQSQLPRGGFSTGSVVAAPGSSPAPNIVVSSSEASLSGGSFRRGRAATKEDVDYGGGGGGGDTPKREPSGFGETLAELFGLKLPAEAVAAENEIVAPEKEESAGGNIFEYASYRYRKLGIKARAGHIF